MNNGFLTISKCEYEEQTRSEFRFFDSNDDNYFVAFPILRLSLSQ